MDARAAYDEWHAAHASGSGPWYDLAATLLERQPDLLQGAQVLEIGCGGGGFANWMACRGPARVVAQDFSPVAIEHASAEHSRPNLTFELGDIEDIPCADATFDVVVSCETIEHVPSPARAVAELARVLRPGGTLLLSTPNYLSVTGLHRVWRELGGRHWDEGGQPIVQWTFLPRTLWWVRRSGLAVGGISADGWYLPVPGRPGGLALHPPRWAVRVVSPLAQHVLVQARKPRRVPAPQGIVSSGA